MTERDRALVGPRDMKAAGSPAWCWQTIHLLQMCYRYLDERWASVDKALDELRAARAWEVIPPDAPYGSLDAMLQAEVGATEAEVEGRLRSVRADAGQEQATKRGPGRPPKETVDNINSFPARPTGTSRKQALRQLRLAEPALHARVLAGEVSPHAAVLAAGLRKRRVSVLLEPAAFARAARTHLTTAQVAELVVLLEEGLE